MDLSCTTDKYDLLYARWLANPGKLLDLAGWKPGMTLLDLCGGTGAVSQEALHRGAKPEDIVLVDLNPRADRLGIKQVEVPAQDAWWHEDINSLRFDVIVCRQAIAYLPLEHHPVDLFLGLRYLLKPEGVLAFNTFVKPRWAFTTYKHLGHRYIEVSGWFRGRVWHLQWCPNLGMNWTRFQWHTKEALFDSLTHFFQDRVEVIETSKSLYFRARGGHRVS